MSAPPDKPTPQREQTLDREQATVRLAGSEDSLTTIRWRELMNHSPYGVIVYRHDGRVKTYSSALPSVLGLTEAEAEHLAASYNILEDPQLEERGQAELVRQAFAGEPCVLPRILYEATTQIEGSAVRRWLEGAIYPVVDDQGTLQEVVVMHADVTRLAETREELLRSREVLADQLSELEQLYAHTPVGLCLMDTELRFVRINETMAQINGRPVAAHLGSRLREVMPELAPEIESDYRRVIESGRPVLDIEVRGPTQAKPGIERDWLVSCHPLKAEDGSVRGVSTVVLDITERIAAEEERRQLEAQLQHSQKLESLGVLAGGIAHDFNNLLVAVLGNADLGLAKLPAESPSRVYLERIKAASQRASELTSQMLAYSGKRRFALAALDLNRLVEEMGHLLQTVVSKKAAMNLDLASELPLLEGDGSQVRQIVMNLITNASEAIGNTTGRIRLRTGVVEVDDAYLSGCLLGDGLPEGSYVYLEVTDSGAGMDSETRRRIFDPFFTTKVRGRGLGLAAVLGIVRAHRAAIRVDSAVGKGSTFTVLFPPSESLRPKRRRQAPSLTIDQTGITVLVVDDEEAVRNVSRDMLEAAGFLVLTAESGVEGVELFRDRADDISVVLLDMTMPQLDGEETLMLLRELRSDVRVVLSSGYAKTARDLGGLNFTGFLQKPYTCADLVRAIREAIEWDGTSSPG